MGWLCGVGIFGLRVFSLSPGLAQRIPNNNNNNNNNNEGVGVAVVNKIIFYCSKSKVFDGQEPLSGESTTTGCGFNYQLLAVIY